MERTERSDPVEELVGGEQCPGCLRDRVGSCGRPRKLSLAGVAREVVAVANAYRDALRPHPILSHPLCNRLREHSEVLFNVGLMSDVVRSRQAAAVAFHGAADIAPFGVVGFYRRFVQPEGERLEGGADHAEPPLQVCVRGSSEAPYGPDVVGVQLRLGLSPDVQELIDGSRPHDVCS